MKKLFIILFSLVAFISNAQNTLNNIGLTSSTPASVAYSLRLLSSSYAGPLVRIKVSTSFYDVYPDLSTNKFSLSSKISASISTYNAAAAAASINALSTIISGSTDATVAIWYDQSGNGVHVLSSTSTAKIITAGTVNTLYGQPTIYFSGSNGQSLLTSSNSVDYSALSGATVNAVAQNVSTTSTFAGIIGAAYAIGNPGYNIAYDSTIGKGYTSDGASCTYGTNLSSTNPQVVTNIFVNTTTNLSNTYINGVLKTSSGSTCPLTHTNGSKIYIGSARGYGPASFIGNISEAIIFPKQVSSGEQTLFETSQTAFYFSPLVTISSSAPNNTSCSGTSVTFTATSYNFTSTPTYQWYKNNVAISGATSSTYVTNDLVNNDAIHVTAVEGGASVSTTGLVLNLDAGNSSSYTSGATSWTDLTEKGNHGTLNNVTYSSSNQGYLSFNGTTSYVSLPNSTDFNFGTGDFTIELWAQNSSASKTPNLLAINSNNSFYSAVRIGWAPNINGNPTMTFNHSTNGNSWSVQTGYTGSFSNWTQIVISRTAGVVTMYANGVNKGTYNLAGSLMTTTTSNPINNQIGTLPNYQSIYTLLGNMSIVRYYKAAGLTSSQVISNYNAICSRYGLSAIGTTSNSITTSVTAGPTVNLTLSGDGCVNKSLLSASTGLSSYAWYKDDALISGATMNTYTPSAAGAYKVSASNGTCSTTSSVTTINTCGVTADGSMRPAETSSVLISKEGATNNGYAIDERGSAFTKPVPQIAAFDFVNPPNNPTFQRTWTSTINGVTATIRGNPTYTSTNGGGLQLVSGSSIDINGINTATTSFTLSMVVDPPTNTDGHYNVFYDGKSGGGRQGNAIWANFWGTNINVGINSEQGVNAGTPSAGITRYDFVYDGSSVKVYKNASIVANGTIPESNGGWSSNLRIGEEYEIVGNFFNGKIYRIKYQKTALDQSAITTQYNAEKTW